MGLGCSTEDVVRITIKKYTINKGGNAITKNCLLPSRNKLTESERVKHWRAQHPNANKKQYSHKRGLGHTPLNLYFNGAHVHHLHLENNDSFCIFIPDWLHYLYPHNVKSGKGMQTINAVSLDFWISDYDFFEGLQVVNDIPPKRYNPILDYDPQEVRGLPWGQFFNSLEQTT